jgi:hypothetical protein
MDFMLLSGPLLWKSLVRSFVLYGFFIVSLSACVIIPYSPESEQALSEEVQFPIDDLLVTVGPRKRLEEVSKAISNTSDRISIVDPVEFRDVAFPDGDWRLTRLLEKGTGQRIFQALGVRYLVLMGELKEAVTNEQGGVGIWVGFYGAGSADYEATLSAILIDLQNERAIYDIQSTAEGAGGGVGLFYGLFIAPDSVGSAEKGLAHKIVDVLEALEQSEIIRIAVLASERLSKKRGMQLRQQDLIEKIESGEGSYQDKLELAQLGYTTPLQDLVNDGDRQASFDLYKITGDLTPIYDLAAGGDRKAKALVGAYDTKKNRQDSAIIPGHQARALADDAEAQYQQYLNLGTQEPLLFLCRAADGNHPDARYRLGVLYENGAEGIPKSDILAAVWYSLAAESGHIWGSSNSDRIIKSLSAEKLKEFSRRLKQWEPGQCKTSVAGEQKI